MYGREWAYYYCLCKSSSASVMLFGVLCQFVFCIVLYLVDEQQYTNVPKLMRSTDVRRLVVFPYFQTTVCFIPFYLMHRLIYWITIFMIVENSMQLNSMHWVIGSGFTCRACGLLIVAVSQNIYTAHKLPILLWVLLRSALVLFVSVFILNTYAARCVHVQSAHISSVHGSGSGGDGSDRIRPMADEVCEFNDVRNQFESF